MRSALPLTAAIAVSLSLLTVAAHASRRSADACAARLTPDAKLVYRASISSVARGGALKDTLTEKTRGLVMAGKLKAENARPAAEAAAACLMRAM